MEQQIKILHLEDQPSDAELIENALKKGKINYKTFVVPDKAGFMNALKNFSYDIILSDHSLASFNSTEALNMVKEAGITVPFVLVTAKMTDEFAASAIKEGAQDYILKDRLGRLPACVINCVEKHRLKVEKDAIQNRADREMKKLTDRLQLATQCAGIGIWEWDIKNSEWIWDKGMYTLYNIDSDQFGSVYEGWVNRLHPDDKLQTDEEIQWALQGKKNYDTEFRIIWGDGSIHNIKAKAIVEKDEHGLPSRMIGANWDITAQKLTEERLIKANRLYTFISQINQSIVRISEDKNLFKSACSIAIEFGNFKMAWIGLFNNHGNTIALVEQKGIPEEDIQLFKDISLKAGGPQEYVQRNCRYFVCNDTANEPGLADWHSMGLKFGVQSCIILPVKKSGQVIGTFNLYSDKINFYDREEIALLQEATGDISFALDAFDKARRHTQAEELVLQNEKLFRALIENNADMITLGNRAGELLYGSPSITAILGYSQQELINMSLFDVVYPDDLPELMESREKLFKNPSRSFHFQHRRKHKNGTWLWCEGTFRNLLDEPGINGIVTNFRDISAKKAAEQQQEFDRNNLEALINNTNDLMWSVDVDYKLITANRRFDEMMEKSFGIKVLKGDNTLTVGYPDEIMDSFKGYYNRAFAGEIFTTIKYTAVPFDSWVDISFYPIRNGGKVVGAACQLRDITEKIKAEQQVVLNERRFRALVENGAEAVAILSPEGKLIYMSPSIERILGYTVAESAKMDLFYLVHPDDLALVENRWQQFVGRYGESVSGLICRMRNKAGEWRWIEGTLTNLLLDPSINGIIDNFRDITEKKLAEETLLLTQFTIDNAADAVFWMTADSRINKVNNAACLMLGYTMEELAMLSIPDIDPYYNAGKWAEHYAELREKGSLFFETSQRTKDGRLIPVEVKANFVKFGDEEFNCSIIRDISERKIAEEKLVRSETKLKEAQAIAQTGNFEIDLFNDTHTWSDEIYNIIGINREDAEPSHQLFLSFVHPDDKIYVETKFAEQVKALNDSSFNFAFIRKDGSSRHGRSDARFEFDKDGTPLRLYGIFQDITDRTLAEIERTNLVKDLLSRNTELEQFAYVASHDLQEPLRMVTSFMTQLEKKYSAVIDDKGRQYIHFAVDGAKRMRQIILDLLDYSRVGKTEDELEYVDFNILIKEILSLYRRQVEEAKAHIVFKNLPTIRTYKTPLRQVFQNLIGNSLKYQTIGNAPLINITCTETKDFYQFAVIDNGIGIATEYLERIFIIFQRLHNKDEYSGTGMGLAIVKKIIESMGGKIWVESTEGAGSTFYFTMIKTTEL